MLVLARRRRQSVVLGDEVIVTVEEILDADGQRLVGASIRLGFESPRSVSICRSELLTDRSGDTRAGGRRRPAQVRAGRTVRIPDAQVRLRIEVPPKIPVRCNGKLSRGTGGAQSTRRTTSAPKEVHHISCRAQDQITICHNIMVAAVDFVRFVFFDQR